MNSLRILKRSFSTVRVNRVKDYKKRSVERPKTLGPLVYRMQLNAWMSILNRGTGVGMSVVFTGIAALSLPGIDEQILPRTVEMVKGIKLLYLPGLAVFTFSVGYHAVKSMMVSFPKAMTPPQVILYSRLALLGGFGYMGAAYLIYSQQC